MTEDHKHGPVTVRVVLPSAAHAAAEAVARAQTEEGLEEVLAAFALDLAALRAGRRAPRLSWALGWLVCETWPRREAAGDSALKAEPKAPRADF